MQIICKFINSVGCPRHLTIASKLLRIKTCLGGVFWVFHGILALLDIYEHRTEFLSREPDFQEFIKKPQNMFSWRFLSVSWYVFFFSIIRHLSREPDFSAKNQIFKKILKCLKAFLVGVFWVFQSIFSIVWHLGREPDFWAENRIFKYFLKSFQTWLVGVFWVFQGTF